MIERNGNFQVTEFLLGVLTGIGLALLLGPSTRGARRTVGRKARRMKSRMRDRLNDMRETLETGIQEVQSLTSGR